MQNSPGGKTVFGLDQNVAALLCYLPFFFVHLIISIAVITQDKENKIVRFHAFQSLFLTLFSTVLQVVLVVLFFVLFLIGGGIASFAIDSATGVPIASIIFMIIWFLFVILIAGLGIGTLVVIVIAMIKAYSLQKWKIPILGKFAEKYAG
ncbi:MAG: hypothetical protein PSX80_02800 [bacterium]|nr:hypothetical protein [bacterium]